ncbi:hypothetical protein DFH08DRAFT_1033805 [Mycena albidolilacea]|uniref:Uncharacterized protein n=1 Tax=Mycena albidolilacea TaxID=1033008 RepID=A0AAD6ZG97_9AGAR|nr:hypothetical protein DFH08DRAFT_1033805 [Mycena albidolilacea]
MIVEMTACASVGACFLAQSVRSTPTRFPSPPPALRCRCRTCAPAADRRSAPRPPCSPFPAHHLLPRLLLLPYSHHGLRPFFPHSRPTNTFFCHVTRHRCFEALLLALTDDKRLPVAPILLGSFSSVRVPVRRRHRARHVRTARHASTTRGAPPQAVVVPGSGSEVASHGQWWYRTTLLLWRADDERRHSTCGVASDAPWRAHPLRAQAEPARRPRILLLCRAHGAPAPGREFYISPWVIAEHTPTATGVALVPGFRTESRRTTVLRAGATSEEHPNCFSRARAPAVQRYRAITGVRPHQALTAAAPHKRRRQPAPELTCGPRATFLWHNVHATCVFSRWVRNGGREAGRWSAAYAAIGASVRAASSHLSVPTRRGDPSSGADRDICVQGRSALSLVRRWNASAAKSERGTFSL